MQKLIGLIIYWAASTYLIKITNYDWTIIVALIIAGTGGVIYGDAE